MMTDLPCEILCCLPCEPTTVTDEELLADLGVPKDEFNKALATLRRDYRLITNWRHTTRQMQPFHWRELCIAAKDWDQARERADEYWKAQHG